MFQLKIFSRNLLYRFSEKIYQTLISMFSIFWLEQKQNYFILSIFLFIEYSYSLSSKFSEWSYSFLRRIYPNHHSSRNYLWQNCMLNRHDSQHPLECIQEWWAPKSKCTSRSLASILLSPKVQREIINIETSKITVESVLTPCPVQGCDRVHIVVICIAPPNRNILHWLIFISAACVCAKTMMDVRVVALPALNIKRKTNTL